MEAVALAARGSGLADGVVVEPDVHGHASPGARRAGGATSRAGPTLLISLGVSRT